MRPEQIERLPASLRALIDELNQELAQPLNVIDKREERYEKGRRMGMRQVIHQLEILLGTPGYRRTE
jgi:hypothetical protein